jgi:hypothetical protein
VRDRVYSRQVGFQGFNVLFPRHLDKLSSDDLKILEFLDLSTDSIIEQLII